MYLIGDRVRAVKALQRMLGVAESGWLDTATRSKIEAIIGRPAPDKIGYADFLMIKEAYLARKRELTVRRCAGIWNAGKAASEYTREEMTRINLLLSEAVVKNRLEAYPPRGAYYTVDSKRAVEAVRRMLLLSEDGGIDTELLYGILMNLRAYEGKNNVKR